MDFAAVLTKAIENIREQSKHADNTPKNAGTSSSLEPLLNKPAPYDNLMQLNVR